MAADRILVVRQNSRPGLFTFQLTDLRNEIDSADPLDITGFVFKLIIKKDVNDADSSALFDLTGAIIDALQGVFSFTLTSEHTTHPAAVYIGEIRWWSSATATAEPPIDAFTVDYVVQQSIRLNEA